jgi:hypothetical protein
MVLISAVVFAYYRARASKLNRATAEMRSSSAFAMTSNGGQKETFPGRVTPLVLPKFRAFCLKLDLATMLVSLTYPSLPTAAPRQHRWLRVR